MKLAEALILRADAQKRISELKERLLNNIKVQEGEEVPENPQQLMAELETLSAQLMRLIQQINKTNAATQLENQSLADALAERDILQLRRGVYVAIVKEASERYDRYSRSEVKLIRTVSVAELQKLLDSLSQAHRELDSKIQGLNWETELIEA